MKVFALIFAAVFAVGVALPREILPREALPREVTLDVDTRNTRLVSDTITGIVEDLSASIKELGLDPLNIEKYDIEVDPLPVAGLLEISASIEDFVFTGLSEIVINNMNFGLLTQRLTYDISLPAMSISGNGLLKATALKEDLNGEGSGKVVIRNLGVKGTVRVSIGIISGIGIRDLNIEAYLDSIDSNIEKLNFLGVDLAEVANYILGTRVHQAFANSVPEISELLEILVWEVLNAQ